MTAAPPRYVISGCSGSGKSTLLEELSRRGYAVVREPGRRIVREELASGGTALPWEDSEAFVDRLVVAYLEDLSRTDDAGAPTFFDRSLVDIASHWLRTAQPLPEPLSHVLAERRYASPVFLSPPWPELFETDAERRHSFAEAEAEYPALRDAYPHFGYETVILPKGAVPERADFVLSRIAER